MTNENFLIKYHHKFKITIVVSNQNNIILYFIRQKQISTSAANEPQHTFYALVFTCYHYQHSML